GRRRRHSMGRSFKKAIVEDSRVVLDSFPMMRDGILREGIACSGEIRWGKPEVTASVRFSAATTNITHPTLRLFNSVSAAAEWCRILLHFEPRRQTAG